MLYVSAADHNLVNEALHELKDVFADAVKHDAKIDGVLSQGLDLPKETVQKNGSPCGE